MMRYVSLVDILLRSKITKSGGGYSHATPNYRPYVNNRIVCMTCK